MPRPSHVHELRLGPTPGSRTPPAPSTVCNRRGCHNLVSGNALFCDECLRPAAWRYPSPPPGYTDAQLDDLDRRATAALEDDFPPFQVIDGGER